MARCDITLEESSSLERIKPSEGGPATFVLSSVAALLMLGKTPNEIRKLYKNLQMSIRSLAPNSQITIFGVDPAYAKKDRCIEDNRANTEGK